ncbi:TonB-dependent receptor domain-containing protein [Hymenobacter sp. BT559]|uniref:TonB-dependent receptor domain-containing protein n=1 Tax=Hymenobacter sp. BT559 TaxID=2795729 RepID=UPI0018EA9539|nr:TonB-dependent receptor [Hymenobacter sp. BT559]MBJ6146459.1 TonB-dependent receptor [Hymenobacter sp. BT559]
MKHVAARVGGLWPLLLLLLLGQRAAAQAPALSAGSGSLTGLVLDSLTQQPVPFASVVLLLPDPSEKAAAGQSADEQGRFELTKLKAGPYRLRVSFVGYGVRTQAVTITDGRLVLGPIRLPATAQKLGEAVVVAQKPLMEVKPDRLVYNAEQDVTNAGGTAQDVLRKAPLLAIDGDDNVTMRGNSNFKVLINNKPSPTLAANLKEALKSIPADQIKSVEVITTPPAKYDGEGTAGIINIVLKKGAKQGLNGTVGASAGTRGSNGNGSLNFRQGKFNFTSSLNGGLNYNNRSSSSSEQVTYRSTRNDTLRQDGSGRSTGYYGSGSLGLDYDPAEHHSLSLNGSFFRYGGTSQSGNVNRYTTPLPGFGPLFLRDTRSTYSGGNAEVTGTYTRTYKQERREWSTILQYAYNGNRNGYEFNQFNNSEQALDVSQASYRERSLTRLPGHEYTLQSDYTLPLGEKNTLDFGLKGIVRLTGSQAQVDTLFPAQTADFVPSRYRGTSFDYRQDVEGVYATYNFNATEKLHLGLGGRVERTGLWAEFTNTNTGIPYRSYVTPLPNANLSYTLSKTSSLRLAYSRRISRPYIYYLNPYVDRSNPISYSYGNPDLDPELTHSVELSYNNFIKTTSFNVALSVLRTGNSIERVSFASTQPLLPVPDEIVPAPNLVLETSANVASNTAFQLNGYLSAKPTEKWSLSLGGNLEYLLLRSTALNLTRRGFAGNYNVNTSYKATKTLTLQGNLYHSLARPVLQGRSSSFIYYGLGLRQTLLKGRADLSFNSQFPFTARRTFAYETSTPAFSQHSRFTNQQRQFRVGFTYRFGQQQATRQRKSIRNDDIKGGGGQSSGG